METLHNVTVVLTNDPFVICEDNSIVYDYYKFRPLTKKLHKLDLSKIIYLDTATYIPCEYNIYHTTIYSSIFLTQCTKDTIILSNSNHFFDFYANFFKFNVLNKCALYKVEKLYYFPHGNPKYTNPNWFNETVFNTFINSTRLLCHVAKSPRLIYIKRLSTCRNIYNSELIEEMLCTFGIVPIVLEHYNLQDQIDIFHNAQFIIGVHGAGLTNIIYCKQSCVIVELKHKCMNNFKIHNCYAQLAHYRRLQNYSQFYSGYKKLPKCKPKNYNLDIDSKALSTYLHNILNST